MLHVEQRGGVYPQSPVVEGKTDAPFTVPAPAETRLGALRYRFWNALAKRPMVLWRNIFVRVQPMPEFEAAPRRPRSIWGVLGRRR